jgi:hypothetical protein
MSMAYGNVFVFGDYEGDLEKIVKVLNGLDYCPDDLKLRVGQNYIYIVTESCDEGPCAIPFRRVLAFCDGREIFRDEAGEALIAEWEAEEEPCSWEFKAEVSLEWLSENVSPLLTKGTLEIVAHWAGRGFRAGSSRLAIRHDGYVESHRDTYFVGLKPLHETDSFTPRARRAKNLAA